MALNHCGNCTAAYAVGLAECPQCHSTERVEEGAVKITRAGVSVNPGEMELRGHPGMSEPMTGVEHPADGTLSPEVTNEDPPGDEAYLIEDGDPGVHAEGLEVLRVPAEGARAEAPAAPPAPVRPPRAPRRSDGVSGSGGVTLPKPEGGAGGE